MNVRALPTWRNPVGDGAKRTRGRVADVGSVGFIPNFHFKLIPIVRAAENGGQAVVSPAVWDASFPGQRPMAADV